MARGSIRSLAVAGTSALAARGAYAGLRRWPPAGEKTWTRTNHRGESVTLLEGPAVAVGAVTAQVAAAAVAARRAGRPVAAPAYPERSRGSAAPLAMAGPPVLAGLGALAFGVLDDLRGSGARRGLRGHLGALARGEVTTGSVKLAGLAATGLAAAFLEAGLLETGLPEAGLPAGAGAGNAPGARGLPRRAGNVIVNAGLIAGGANLLNLFDLRPGRAIKVAALSAGMIAVGGTLAPPALAAGREGAASVPERLVPERLVPERPYPGPLVPGRLAGLAAVAAPVGAALALLPEDLGERAMLGDAGANALGAALGAAAARALPGRARLCLLGGIVALTLASEKVSFTRVIAATPPLHWLDMLGRRPVPAAGSDGTAAGRTAAGGTPDGSPGGTAPEAAPVPAPWDPLVPRHRRPGRHRRAAGGESRARAGAWVPAFLKTRARPER